MSKYIKLNPSKTSFESAIYYSKPSQIITIPDSELYRYNWFKVEEEYPDIKPLNIHEQVLDKWEIKDDIVVVTYKAVRRPREQVVATQIEMINQIKNTKVNSTISIFGIQFSTDQNAKLRILGATLQSLSGGPDYKLNWVSSNGDIYELNLNSIRLLGDSFVKNESSIVYHAADLEQQVNSSKNPEEVDVDSGWPDSTYPLPSDLEAGIYNEERDKPKLIKASAPPIDPSDEGDKGDGISDQPEQPTKGTGEDSSDTEPTDTSTVTTPPEDDPKQ